MAISRRAFMNLSGKPRADENDEAKNQENTDDTFFKNIIMNQIHMYLTEEPPAFSLSDESTKIETLLDGGGDVMTWIACVHLFGGTIDSKFCSQN